MTTAQRPRTIAFVCLHGSAKSLIAAEYLNRSAAARGAQMSATASGQEPDAEIPPHVVAGLHAKGFDVEGWIPAPATAERLAAADRVIAFGCELADVAPGRIVEQWADCPAVSEDFDAAWAYISARVDRMLETPPK